ncbi:Hypothetical_protein [Hexamita inflata]|uniref:Hypothetical_protein n=1 Tax=Hexamita inflata TaxID=28002 RepID=A0AA86PPG0_9EUKA|nr:Hypothetical protein HINF_LOCUS29622 [Hexamita inflata]
MVVLGIELTTQLSVVISSPFTKNLRLDETFVKIDPAPTRQDNGTLTFPNSLDKTIFVTAGLTFVIFILQQKQHYKHLYMIRNKKAVIIQQETLYVYPSPYHFSPSTIKTI